MGGLAVTLVYPLVGYFIDGICSVSVGIVFFQGKQLSINARIVDTSERKYRTLLQGRAGKANFIGAMLSGIAMIIIGNADIVYVIYVGIILVIPDTLIGLYSIRKIRALPVREEEMK